MDVDARSKIATALEGYRRRTGHALESIRAVMFDMDGVLYDSMPLHARAWKMLCEQAGIEADRDEFYAYEGRTGASTIDLLIRRQFGRPATEEEKKSLYALKAHYFTEMPKPPIMPGALESVGCVLSSGRRPVLVTGSGQASVLERLKRDFHNAFELRVTAADVVRGKPDPEPYIKGMALAESPTYQSVAIDNAPLGVESASKAGAFTIGVVTGPLPEGALADAGADIVIYSMTECADLLSYLLL